MQDHGADSERPLMMRPYLRELGFTFDDSELDPIVRLLEGARRQRLKAKRAIAKNVTRTTALVVLAKLAPEIEHALEKVDFDWQRFRQSIGIEGKIRPVPKDDVELHEDFKTALERFARKYPDRLRPTPTNLATAILEMVIESPEVGALGGRFKKFGPHLAALPTEFDSGAPLSQHCVKKIRLSRTSPRARCALAGPGWLSSNGMAHRPWTRAAERGSKISWKVGKANIDAMQTGDPVVYWRTITKGADSGGIVGTGRILSPIPFIDEEGVGRVRTEVREIFDDTPLEREAAIKETGLSPNVWDFSLYALPDDVADRMHSFLLVNGRNGFVADPAEKPPTRHEIDFASDRPETSRDLLGRAPLAFALAAQINRIWDAQVSGDERTGWWRRLCDALHMTRPKRQPLQPDDAAFVLHIDAPWGGGKTTFANFIGRILNPQAFELNTSADSQALFNSLPLDDDAFWSRKYRKRRWHVIQFNAWQHEHVSPPWWNIYEVIRRQSLLGLVRRPTDAVGDRPCLLGEGMSGFAQRLRQHGQRLWYIICESLWRIWSPATRRAVFTTMLLGFAALFLHRIKFFEWLNSLKIDGVELTTIVAAIASGGIGVLVFGAVRSGLSTFVESVSSSADAVSLGEADPLHRFQNHFSWLIRQLGAPVLVIIDDLDRCKPEFVVEILRGLLTIFRSPRVVFLLLGDKAWIEQAFEQVHADMERAHKNSHINFGAHFAEKAIQLSFILPEANEEDRNAYLLALLTGEPLSTEKGQDTTTEGEQAKMLSLQLDNFGRKVRKRFAEVDDTDALVRMKDVNRSDIEEHLRSAGQDMSESVAERFRQAARQKIEVEALFRSSTSTKSESDIRHGLEPVAPFLPGNPRRIKRIVNMVSAFQESGQIAEQIDPLRPYVPGLI